MEKYTVIVENGDTFWCKYGTSITHRENGPARECADGTKKWFKDGLYHREDGPAIEYANGDKEWFKRGYVHRANGPAIEYANGHKEWHLEGKLYTEAEFNKLTQKNIDPFDGKEAIIEGKKYKLTLIDK